MKKRYVFDLDGTLVEGDYRLADQYFIDKFGPEAIPFVQSMSDVLSKYERAFLKYQPETLSKFLRLETGLDITEKDILEWNHLVSIVQDKEEEHARETLEYLKSQGKSLVVLTNWFSDSQKERLRRMHMLSYFDAVYGGEIATKPHKEAYLNAIMPFSRMESVFVGDNVGTDYVGPRACSIDAVLYDKKNEHHKTLIKVKSLDELKRIDY